MTDIPGARFRSKRYILRERDEEVVVRRLVASFGGSVVTERAAKKRKNIARAVIWEIIPGLTIGYYDDVRAEASCLIVRSERDIVEVQAYEDLLRQNLDFLEDSDLLAALQESEPGTKGQILCLLRLGLGAPLDFDQRFFDQLSLAVQSVKLDVRIAALRGMTYTEWPQFRPLLQRIASSDSDKPVRELASKIVSVYDKYGLGES
jgi:hypothetical protein